MLKMLSMCSAIGPVMQARGPGQFGEALLAARISGIPRSSGLENETLWFFISLIPVLAIGLSHMLNPKVLKSVELATQLRETESPFADQSIYRNLGLINVLMLLALIIGTSVLISSMEQQFKLFDLATHVALVIALLLAKVLIILVFGGLFYDGQQVGRQFLMLNAHLRLLGIVTGIIPLVILFGLENEQRQGATYLVLLTVVGVYIASKALVLRRLTIQTPYQITYHLLYICAAEIAPVLVFIEVFF